MVGPSVCIKDAQLSVGSVARLHFPVPALSSVALGQFFMLSVSS